MKYLVLACALSLGAAACDNRPATPPSPKTDGVSSVSPGPANESDRSAAAGSSTTPANAGAPSRSEKREGANPVQGQVDPKHAEQHRDFQKQGDGAGPKSADTKPTITN